MKLKEQIYVKFMKFKNTLKKKMKIIASVLVLVKFNEFL